MPTYLHAARQHRKCRLDAQLLRLPKPGLGSRQIAPPWVPPGHFGVRYDALYSYVYWFALITLHHIHKGRVMCCKWTCSTSALGGCVDERLEGDLIRPQAFELRALEEDLRRGHVARLGGRQHHHVEGLHRGPCATPEERGGLREALQLGGLREQLVEELQGHGHLAGKGLL